MNQKSPESTQLADKARGLITTKQTKHRPVTGGGGGNMEIYCSLTCGSKSDYVKLYAGFMKNSI